MMLLPFPLFLSDQENRQPAAKHYTRSVYLEPQEGGYKVRAFGRISLAKNSILTCERKTCQIYRASVGIQIDYENPKEPGLQAKSDRKDGYI